jgi:hypothetical protein
MELNEIEVAYVCTRVLAGDSWVKVAKSMRTTQHQLRRCIAEKLKLHVPKRRNRK